MDAEFKREELQRELGQERGVWQARPTPYKLMVGTKRIAYLQDAVELVDSILAKMEGV